MDTRSTRYRSVDSKGVGPSPKVRDRHNSVPTSDRQRSQQPRRQSAASKPFDQGQRSSKASPRDDPSLTSPDRKSSSTRQSDRHQLPIHTNEVKASSKVCIIFLIFTQLSVVGIWSFTTLQSLLSCASLP